MVQKFDWNDRSGLALIEKMLQDGKIIAGTSDTVIGLLAAATKRGRAALDQIKQRKGMPYLLLVKDKAIAHALSDAFKQEKIAKLAQAFWPGPLTLIVPAKKSVPAYLTSASGAIALRVPAHKGLQQLLAHADLLFSTSANLSGMPVPDTVEAIVPELQYHLAALISDDMPATKLPSTILDCTREVPVLIREGAISRQRLQEYL